MGEIYCQLSFCVYSIYIASQRPNDELNRYHDANHDYTSNPLRSSEVFGCVKKSSYYWVLNHCIYTGMLLIFLNRSESEILFAKSPAPNDSHVLL